MILSNVATSRRTFVSGVGSASSCCCSSTSGSSIVVGIAVVVVAVLGRTVSVFWSIAPGDGDFVSFSPLSFFHFFVQEDKEWCLFDLLVTGIKQTERDWINIPLYPSGKSRTLPVNFLPRKYAVAVLV